MIRPGRRGSTVRIDKSVQWALVSKKGSFLLDENVEAGWATLSRRETNRLSTYAYIQCRRQGRAGQSSDLDTTPRSLLLARSVDRCLLSGNGTSRLV